MSSNSVQKGDAFLTIGLVAAITTVRIFSEFMKNVVPCVAALNAFMLLYVFYKVNESVMPVLVSRKGKNEIFQEQYKRYIRYRNTALIIFFIVFAIYIISTWMNPIMNKAGGCINDIIAFITFGLSIEDERITDMVKGYFVNKNFKM